MLCFAVNRKSLRIRCIRYLSLQPFFHANVIDKLSTKTIICLLVHSLPHVKTATNKAKSSQMLMSKGVSGPFWRHGMSEKTARGAEIHLFPYTAPIPRPDASVAREMCCG